MFALVAAGLLALILLLVAIATGLLVVLLLRRPGQGR